MRGVISQDAWPKIVYYLLTLLFMMAQRGYCHLVCLYMQAKITLWLTTTSQRCDFPRCMTNNHWHSIDANFHDTAGRVLLSVLPIKAGKNTFMTEYSLSEVWFPTMQDQKLLMLHWHSFWHGCIHNMQSINLAQSIIHIVFAAFLAF
jgi:hypothetical protein